MVVASVTAFAGPINHQGRFEEALSLISRGQAVAGAAILEKLYEETRAPRIRLELARAYFFLGRHEEAKALFIVAYEDHPPASVKASIIEFIDTIEKIEGKASFGVSAARIQNPLRLPSQMGVYFGGAYFQSETNPKQKNVFGVLYNFSYEKRFSDGYEVRIQSSLRDLENSFADFAYLDGSIGKQFSFFPADIRFGSQVFRMKGQNYQMPYTELGTKLPIMPMLALSPRIQIGYFKLIDADGLSGETYRAFLPLEIAFAPHQAFIFGAKAEKRTAKYLEQSYTSFGPYAELRMGFEKINVNSSVSFRKSNYASIDPFWDTKRKDYSFYTSTEIGLDFLRIKGFMPSVGAYCDLNRSKIAYFNSKDCGAITNLRKIY